MTITIAWLRKRNKTIELMIASDSRLRSFGAMDQAQKIVRLDRGDCALAFCGDAQVAYPFFIQVGTALNNFKKTRSTAEDVTKVAAWLGQILQNLVDSWDAKQADKEEQLASTRILFGGWSWLNKRFDIGFFIYQRGIFHFKHSRVRLPHPWRETSRSLVFIGDYETDYMHELNSVLGRKYPDIEIGEKKVFDFDYEPIEALHELLKSGSHLVKIGGSTQAMKIYTYGSSLPIVTRNAGGAHCLLGRSLFKWEKTEYPILDLTQSPAVVLYPMSAIPLPSEVSGRLTVLFDDEPPPQ